MSNEVSAATQALREKLKGHLTYDNGTVSVAKDAFTDTLPENLTVQTFKDVESHKKSLAAALLAESAALAESDMKANKIPSVSSYMDLGGTGAIETHTARSAVRSNPQTKEEFTVYGASRVKISSAASKKSGDLKKVMTTVSERAKSLWG